MAVDGAPATAPVADEHRPWAENSVAVHNLPKRPARRGRAGPPHLHVGTIEIVGEVNLHRASDRTTEAGDHDSDSRRAYPSMAAVYFTLLRRAAAVVRSSC
ncbi:hypothetical protein Atai01_37520 [Amycolatopsis taiwanensis]|uniref:Uncharacterized protein n=1 Tax=Amycolatopsis taiwanensis TaxID=342230 RepID=A0A9W6VDB6_9PSEU|nr:hypothetical protein Atai01_37520 [Amycolatopsis taiwanensis]